MYMKKLKNGEGINFTLNFLKKAQAEILKTELTFQIVQRVVDSPN